MDRLYQFIENSRFFSHCTYDEIQQLTEITRESSIKSGQEIDLRKSSSLNIIIDGIFKIESAVKNEYIYLSPQSFFGEIPFTNNKTRGYIKAVTDARLCTFDNESLHKFFLMNHKALRGYIKTIKKWFDISDTGKDFKECRIITVYSNESPAGKSIFSSYLAMLLANQDKTILLDMSHKGNSLFNIFGKKITPAIAQKQIESAHESMINNRIEIINDKLSIINIVNGSRVKVNPEIISPLLISLSKDYKYIIMDTSDYDTDLRDRVFELSDIILPLLKKQKDRFPLHDLFEAKIKQGQRIYYVINRFYSRDNNKFEGVYIFDKIDLSENNTMNSIDKFIKSSTRDFADILIKKTRCIVAQANLMESIAYAPLLKAVHNTGIDVDIFYSSSYSYLILAIFLISREIKDFEKSLSGIFKENWINNILNISFPTEYVFNINKISRFAENIAGDRRIESFKNLPMIMAVDKNQKKRIFSSGALKDMISASLAMFPLYEPVKINKETYYSGFPLRNARVEDMFRTDIDEIIYASVKISNKMNSLTSKLTKFYQGYMDFLYDIKPSDKSSNADKHIEIEIDEKLINIKKILELSDSIAKKLS